MRHLWQEFRSFAFKGNMIELAIAVVIGAAFGTVINSLVKHIIMPLISYVFPNQGGYRAWHIGRLMVGEFLGDVLNFIIVALAVFLMIVKLLDVMMKKAAPPPASAEPVTRECPMCLMVIPIKARKCGHCTSDVSAP